MVNQLGKSGLICLTILENFKEELMKPVVLALYDPAVETKICKGGSTHGLGGGIKLQGKGNLDSLPAQIFHFRLRLSPFDHSISHHIPE